jgi:hypothetical protein
MLALFKNESIFFFFPPQEIVLTGVGEKPVYAPYAFVNTLTI